MRFGRSGPKRMAVGAIDFHQSESISRNGSGTVFTALKFPVLFKCSFSSLHERGNSEQEFGMPDSVTFVSMEEKSVIVLEEEEEERQLPVEIPMTPSNDFQRSQEEFQQPRLHRSDVKPHHCLHPGNPQNHIQGLQIYLIFSIRQRCMPL